MRRWENGEAYDVEIASQRELVEPPLTLAGVKEISGPALVAILFAGVVAVLDGIAADTAMLIGLLAIPPVIAAMSASLPETGIVGAACVVLAVLSGLWNENVGSDEFAVGVMTVIAGSLAGLWVASLREQVNRQQISAELLAEAGAAMEEAMDQGGRAEEVARLAVPALGDVAMVDLMSQERTIVRMGAESTNPKLAAGFVHLREKTPIRIDGPHPVAVAIRTGETQELNELSDELIDQITTDEEERELLRRNRFHHCLVLPLRARGAVLGALTLWITRSANGFDPIARRTAQRLSERAALALDNAHLHEQQSHIAGVLQHSLLPRSLPEVPGFEVASYFMAAGEATYEVGGDFYDVFRTGSASWSVVMGDVCGKGPEAAALTSLARYTVRTASHPDASPSSVLRVLHESISADRSDLRFCTAALLRLDPPSNGRGQARVTVSLGGHPPPIIVRGDGSAEEIGEPGTLLGAIAEPSLRDAPGRLAPGDSLVLYTDGVLASGSRRGDDDQGWLAQQLSKTSGDEPQQIAERLATAAIRRQGGEPRDDIAVLILRRRAGSARRKRARKRPRVAAA